MSIDKTTYSFQQNELNSALSDKSRLACSPLAHYRLGSSRRGKQASLNFSSQILEFLMRTVDFAHNKFLDCGGALGVLGKNLGYIVGYFYAYLKERTAKKSKKRGR